VNFGKPNPGLISGVRRYCTIQPGKCLHQVSLIKECDEAKALITVGAQGRYRAWADERVMKVGEGSISAVLGQRDTRHLVARPTAIRPGRRKGEHSLVIQHRPSGIGAIGKPDAGKLEPRHMHIGPQLQKDGHFRK
jgi:hypothetical protein